MTFSRFFVAKIGKVFQMKKQVCLPKKQRRGKMNIGNEYMNIHIDLSQRKENLANERTL